MSGSRSDSLLKMRGLGGLERKGFSDSFHLRDWPTECIVNARVCQARLPWTKARCVSRTLLMKRKQFGFSLIELLIVVAIILIIPPIPIPTLITAHISPTDPSSHQ